MVMSALIESSTKLSYLVNDTDEHSTPPTSAYQQYVDAEKRHLAITDVRRDNGRHEMIWGGKPDPSPVKSYGQAQVTGSREILAEVGVDERGRDAELTTAPIPGSLLNKLNPLKELDEEGRKEFARRYRALQEQLNHHVGGTW
jgi:hypothetical protein